MGEGSLRLPRLRDKEEGWIGVFRTYLFSGDDRDEEVSLFNRNFKYHGGEDNALTRF
jgi:hypothetical protein